MLEGFHKGTAAPVAAAAIVMSWMYFRRRASTEKLAVASMYKRPNFPLAIRILANLPAFLRRPLLLKGAAPEPPLDGVDLINEGYDPFSVTELVRGKIWRVRYQYANDSKVQDAVETLFGIDMTDKSILTRIKDPKTRIDVEVHMDRAAELKAKCHGYSTNEKRRCELEAGCHLSQDMLVARLSDNESLLVYNPCRMHKTVVDFLNNLGRVSYIVSGSSVHTNQLPQAASVFETAKIVCAQVAEDKCMSVGMRKANFVYTQHDDGPRGYAEMRKELGSLGVETFHVLGDVATQALAVIVYDHLFDTDLSCYGNGNRLLHSDDAEWKEPPPSLGFQQVLYYATIADSSVPGILPDFRIMAMDTSSAAAKLALDEPDADSCQVMADSLRQLLKLDFAYVDNVHSRKQGSLAASDFREFVQHAWNWLDGESLLAS